MRLERVKRWQWVVISIAVGVALAYARRTDPDAVLARLGEGVADQRWFESELARTVSLADGSTLRAFDRLTVYPMSIRDGTRRKPVHIVAGMRLTESHSPAGSATGKLRACFFVATVPFNPLPGRDAGKPPVPGATVARYLDGLEAQGVTYSYAWWTDARYATAAWVGGSFSLIGVVWPTVVNLLAFGSFRAPPQEKGVSLWRVKTAARSRARPKQSLALESPLPSHDRGETVATAPTVHMSPRPADGVPHEAVSSLAAEPLAACPSGMPDHKEFGAKRDDFYPTELKTAPHRAVPGAAHH